MLFLIPIDLVGICGIIFMVLLKRRIRIEKLRFMYRLKGKEKMKKSYKVKGIDCANCAAKLEKNLNKIEGIDHASVVFMTEKLVIEAPDDKFDAVLEEAVAVAKKLEPDWEIVVK